MSDLRKAAQQALEELEFLYTHKNITCARSIHDLRAALAQPVQVPVAWLRHRDSCLALNDAGLFGDGWSPLYAHPPQRKPLTEDEIDGLAINYDGLPNSFLELARDIEKAHGIGGVE
jgi:hypothetical protein